MKKQPFSTALQIVVLSTLLTATAQGQQPSAGNGGSAPAQKVQAAPTARDKSAAAGKQAPAQNSKASAAAKTKAEMASETPPVTALTTPRDKASYAVGMNIGNNLHRQGADVDLAILTQGIKDSFAGGTTLLTEDEARRALMDLQAELRKKQQEQARLLGEKNKKKGDAFLAANKTKEGVNTLSSGLQYKILQGGAGPKPKATDLVVCNYRGTLIDSTEFDSSFKRGQPATFQVNRVIQGWQEALQLMPVGSKWQLFVPPELAYGERGAGAAIGPNSTLVFEVELISIKEKPVEHPAEKPADKPADRPSEKPAEKATEKPADKRP